MMNKEQVLEQMRYAQSIKDNEEAHERADFLLCELLKSLDCSDVVEEYNKVKKWYA